MLYEEVTPHVVFAQNEQGSNSSCIALANELVFIDAGLNTTTAAKFRKAMEEKFQLKTSTLLCTHGHIDHFLGLGAFADVKVIAAEQAKNRFQQFVTATFTEQFMTNYEQIFPGFTEAIKIANLFMPHEWVKDSFSMGKNNALVFKVTGGHSSCSSSIYFAPEKVVIAGDLMQVDVYPYFGEPDTDLTKWIDTLKEWEALNPYRIISGHGRAVDKEYLSNVRLYFENILELISTSKQQLVSYEEMVTEPKFFEGYWPKDAIMSPMKKSSYLYSLGVIYNKID
ncbi:MAG: MBL fold metallo-hydrolase [Asgard group archaeon]|nr:MBL fold metallo-hydrolase [Asgard group archaeon]